MQGVFERQVGLPAEFVFGPGVGIVFGAEAETQGAGLEQAGQAAGLPWNDTEEPAEGDKAAPRERDLQARRGGTESGEVAGSVGQVAFHQIDRAHAAMGHRRCRGEDQGLGAGIEADQGNLAPAKAQEDRADLLAYLQTLSDNPVPFPAPAPAEAEATGDEAGGEMVEGEDAAMTADGEAGDTPVVEEQEIESQAAAAGGEDLTTEPETTDETPEDSTVDGEE